MSKFYGETPALLDVTFEANAGTVTAIVGGNGSGKSTLIRVLARQLMPTSGTVYYADPGHSVPGLTKAYTCVTDDATLQQHIGLLSHELSLYASLSARENIDLRAKLFGLAPTETTAAIVRFGIEPFADRPLQQCSRGQKQRAMLAVATLHDPTFVLMDEPSTGLDSDGIRTLQQTLNNLRTRGCIVVMVTHSEHEASSWCDRRLELSRGRLVA